MCLSSFSTGVVYIKTAVRTVTISNIDIVSTEESGRFTALFPHMWGSRRSFPVEGDIYVLKLN